MKPTIATTQQELKDFKDMYIRDRAENLTNQGKLLAKVEEVLEQAKKTNGRVTKVETLQIDCPARDSYKKGKPFQTTVQIITLVLVGLAFLISLKNYTN